MGLNEVYDVVRLNILCKDPSPSLSIAYTFLVFEEVAIAKPPIEMITFKV